jgi:26S proteasome regulatory subunit N8
MSVKTNDQLMAIYLSSLIRAITAFHDLIENKIQNRQSQEDKDGKADGVNGEAKKVEEGEKKDGEAGKAADAANGEKKGGSPAEKKEGKKKS